MDELKKLKKNIKIWEGTFEKTNGRKAGKDDINANNEIKALYRKYIELKKASTSRRDENAVAREQTCVVKETECVPKEAASVTKNTSIETPKGVGASTGIESDIRSPHQSDLNNGNFHDKFKLLSIPKESKTSGDKGTATAISLEGDFTSDVPQIGENNEDVWGAGLNRAHQIRNGNDKTSEGSSKEKKSTGSLFEKIGKRMLSKAMQAPKLKPDKSHRLPWPGSSNQGISSTERRSSFHDSTRDYGFNQSNSNCLTDETKTQNKQSSGSGLIFEKALKLSNIKTKSAEPDSGKTHDVCLPVTLESMKSRIKSYSQVPTALLDEEFDAVDCSWKATTGSSLTLPSAPSSEKVNCEPRTLQSYSGAKQDAKHDTSTPEPYIKDQRICTPKSSTSKNKIGVKPPSQISANGGEEIFDENFCDDSFDDLTIAEPITATSVTAVTPGKRKLGHVEQRSTKRRKVKKSLSGEPVPDVVWDNETIDPFEDKGSEKEDDASDDNTPLKKPKATKARPKKSVRNPSTINDNFVALNMKVKRYRRKGQQVSGPAFKRKMWKQKMKARSQSFGSDKCFKCGETGHWANKCPGGKNKYQKSSSAGTYRPEEPDIPVHGDAGMENGTTVEARPSLPPIVNHEDILNPENIVRAGLREHAPPPPPVEAVYEPNPDGSVPPTPNEVYKFLNKIGHKSFRAGQEAAVMRILSGLSTLLILSTGAGKSLCYQLPAFIYAQKRKCVTLVISPLVSLMEDQVSGLPPGIKGACLHTNMTKSQREKILSSLHDGKLHFLIVSPEALVGSSTLNPSKLPPIAFACIDEVHCVSEWSHHFRPSYLRVCHVLKERLGVKCILGLTATATLTTAASVAQHLGIEDYMNATIRGTTVPDNLYPSVSLDEDRIEALIQLLQDDRFSSCNSIIIYCTRREQASRLATVIRTQLGDKTKPKKRGQAGRPKKSEVPEADLTHWDAECYHAGLTPAQRKRVQNQFMSGRLRVVVATVAFGMGLDKSDVRAVIHFNMPKTFESYVQEIGRAGRDGDPAQCHVFLDRSDMNELKKHTYGNSIDRHIIKKLVKKLFPKCRCDAEKHCEEEKGDGSGRLCPGHERALPIATTVQDLDIKEEGIATLLCYLELHPKRWVENMLPAYATCSINCYNGPQQFREVAKKYPPAAAAIALDMKRGVDHSNSRSITFPIVEVSDMMAWDSGIVKREISNMQWNLNLGGKGPSKSGVMVEFSDLAFHFTSHGDLTDDEVDEVVDFLHDRVSAQENTEIRQLHNFYSTLKSVAYKQYYHCSGTLDSRRSDLLKNKLREYFDSQPNVDLSNVTKLTFIREDGTAVNEEEEATCENETQVNMDIRNFIHTYGHDHNLTGRSIARVFHGIPSPCFPADVWGRVRRFWRSHLNVDFNLLRKMATRELIRMK